METNNNLAILSNENVNELKDIAKQIKVLETRQKQLKNDMLDKAKELKVANESNNGVFLSYAMPSIEMVFDSEKFMEENPLLASQYLKPVFKDGGYRIIVRGVKDE